MNQAVDKPERRLPALAVSRGIGMGHVVFLHGGKRQFFRIDLDAAQVESELERLRTAVLESTAQLRSLSVNTDPDPNQPVSSIFGVHLLILEESSLLQKIGQIVTDQMVNAEWALKLVSDEYLKRQESVADPRFREKYLDIQDVAERLLASLSGSVSRAESANSGAVVVARELRPSAILELQKNTPAALITEWGGWTSHTSILAREFQLPMVSGIRNLERTLSHGDLVIVDGINGEVVINPAPQTIDNFKKTVSEPLHLKGTASANMNGCNTLDGTEILIRVNLDLPDAYPAAKQHGAQGIGLYRSESLITRPGLIPSEDDQFSAYRRMAAVAGAFGVKIRTFDIGIDQDGDDGYSPERNPSLGLRSIRLSLADTSHFRTQIRAILRASATQKIDIVLPMISGVAEILRSKTIIAEERDRLAKERIPAHDPQIGAMIEIPSAVLTAREIARHVDFFCLGTNDLVQYLLAVDRDNDSVADWYQTLHPAVLRAITAVLEAAADAGIPAAVCGEMAGSAFYVPLLIGLGARELSMNANSIHQVKNLISGITVEQTTGLVEEIKGLETAESIEIYLRKQYVNRWKSLFPTGLLNSRHR